jgi:serine/threonine-protein kinase
MSDETKPLSAHGEQEAMMDSDNIMNKELDDLDRLIICSLAGMVLPTHEKETIAMSRPDEETHLVTSPAAETAPLAASHKSLSSADRSELMNRYDACRQVEVWKWKSDFRKNYKEIGSGGQGIVYSIESVDPFFANRALKVHSPAPYDHAEAYQQDMGRMESVASVVEQICHSNLVQVERFESWQEIHYLVMREIAGFDVRYLQQRKNVEKLRDSVTAERWAELNDVMFAAWGSDRRALKPGVAVYIIENCLRGVSALHDKAIVHCDIKPSNVMLSEDGNVRLIDIGSAHKIGSRPKHYSWTPRYVPPEVLEGGQWTETSDLASLGYMLIEWLSGRPDVLIETPGVRPEPVAQAGGSKSVTSLDEATRKALAAAKYQLPDRLEELIPSEAQRSSRLKELCKRLIHPDPTNRFANARMAIDDWAGTRRFLRELTHANLDAHWVQVLEHWIRDMKNAAQRTIDKVR